MNYSNKILLIWLTLLLNFGFCVSCSKMLATSGCCKHKNAKKNHIHITTNPSNRTANEPPKPPLDENEKIEEQLLNAAQSIEKSLANLAASQEINNVPVLNTAPLLTQEGGMGHTANIDWTGPLEPLLEKIANLTNYNLKFLGNPSPIPIIVSITQNKALIADILKNAALQAGNRANIVVFPANRIIELRYKFGSYNPSYNSKTNLNDHKHGRERN